MSLAEIVSGRDGAAGVEAGSGYPQRLWPSSSTALEKGTFNAHIQATVLLVGVRSNWSLSASLSYSVIPIIMST